MISHWFRGWKLRLKFIWHSCVCTRLCGVNSTLALRPCLCPFLSLTAQGNHFTTLVYATGNSGQTVTFLGCSLNQAWSRQFGLLTALFPLYDLKFTEFVCSGRTCIIDQCTDSLFFPILFEFTTFFLLPAFLSPTKDRCKIFNGCSYNLFSISWVRYLCTLEQEDAVCFIYLLFNKHLCRLSHIPDTVLSCYQH